MKAGAGKSWLAGILLCAAAASAGAQQVQVSAANRTVAITTTEEAERRADTATVHIGYQLYAATSSQVTQQAGSLSRAITDALLRAGVPSQAIESEGQSTGPAQEYQPQESPQERVSRQFQAQQSWAVRVGADAASTALAAAVGAGANQSGAIDWSVADEASLSAEAAGKALKHAQAIAEQMASGLGARLGPLVYASNEAQSLGVRPVFDRVQRIAALQVAPETKAKLSLGAPMVRRSATVSAVFALQ